MLHKDNTRVTLRAFWSGKGLWLIWRVFGTKSPCPTKCFLNITVGTVKKVDLEDIRLDEKKLNQTCRPFMTYQINKKPLLTPRQLPC